MARPFVSNPSTGKTIVSVPSSAARKPRPPSPAPRPPAWSAKTGKERAAILLKWSQLMQHQKDLAAIMTSEQGKPVTEAAGEIASSFLEWFAEEAKRIDGDVLQSPRPASACWRSSSPSASPPPSRRGTSGRHDHAQGRPGAGRRLHHGAQPAQQTR